MLAIKKTFGTSTEFSTVRTGLRSEIWADLNHPNPQSIGFVSDTTLQLIETPIIQPKVKSSSFTLFSYAFKVFQYNCSSFTIIHNLLTYDMVPICHKPFLSTRDFPKQSLSRPCAFGLEFISKLLKFDSFEFNLSCIEKHSVGSDSHVIYSDINTKNSIMQVRANGVNIFRETKQEETSAFFVYSQQTFSEFPFKIFFVTVRNVYIELLPSFDCGNAQNIVFERSRSWEVVSYRSSVDNWFGFGSFDKTTGLFDTGHSQLALQTPFTQGLINKRVKLDIVLDFAFPCLINTELQPFSINLECSDYFFSWTNPDFCCCSNLHNYGEYTELYKVSPPTVKTVGIRNEGV